MLCCAESLSSVQLCNSMTGAHQAPLSIGFSRQESWRGIKPRSPVLQADSLSSEPPGKPKNTRVGSLSLLQGNFPTQESNQGLLHCRWILYHLSYQRSSSSTPIIFPLILPDVQAGFRKSRGTRDQIANIHWMGFPHSSVGKESTCNEGDPSSIPGSGRSAGEGIGYLFQYSWASFVAQLVKNLPTMQETWVRFLGWKGPLEKGKATHSNILGFPLWFSW